MQGNSPCHHGYMAVALGKQQKGTADPREMTHSWCRNNFSCREDTLHLLRPGRGHVLMPGATEGCWVVLHMASMVPLESQHRLRTSPAHLLLTGSKRSGSPCCFHFLLYIREHRAAPKHVIQGVFKPQLNLFWALCMFHTHSMITFVLRCKRKDAAQLFLVPHGSREADLLGEEETFSFPVCH